MKNEKQTSESQINRDYLKYNTKSDENKSMNELYKRFESTRLIPSYSANR